MSEAPPKDTDPTVTWQGLPCLPAFSCQRTMGLAPDRGWVLVPRKLIPDLRIVPGIPGVDPDPEGSGLRQAGDLVFRETTAGIERVVTIKDLLLDEDGIEVVEPWEDGDALLRLVLVDMRAVWSRMSRPLWLWANVVSADAPPAAERAAVFERVSRAWAVGGGLGGALAGPAGSAAAALAATLGAMAAASAAAVPWLPGSLRDGAPWTLGDLLPIVADALPGSPAVRRISESVARAVPLNLVSPGLPANIVLAALLEAFGIEISLNCDGSLTFWAPGEGRPPDLDALRPVLVSAVATAGHEWVPPAVEVIGAPRVLTQSMELEPVGMIGDAVVPLAEAIEALLPGVDPQIAARICGLTPEERASAMAPVAGRATFDADGNYSPPLPAPAAIEGLPPFVDRGGRVLPQWGNILAALDLWGYRWWRVPGTDAEREAMLPILRWGASPWGNVPGAPVVTADLLMVASPSELMRDPPASFTPADWDALTHYVRGVTPTGGEGDFELRSRYPDEVPIQFNLLGASADGLFDLDHDLGIVRFSRPQMLIAGSIYGEHWTLAHAGTQHWTPSRVAMIWSHEQRPPRDAPLDGRHVARWRWRRTDAGGIEHDPGSGPALTIRRPDLRQYADALKRSNLDALTAEARRVASAELLRPRAWESRVIVCDRPVARDPDPATPAIAWTIQDGESRTVLHVGRRPAALVAARRDAHERRLPAARSLGDTREPSPRAAPPPASTMGHQHGG